MTKSELEEELDKVSVKLAETELENLRLKAQLVLIGIALEDFKTEEDQSTLATIHGLIAEYHQLESDHHTYLREDINTCQDYR